MEMCDTQVIEAQAFTKIRVASRFSVDNEGLKN